MNQYSYHPDLEGAMLRHAFGMDSCQDREILREWGGPNYWHLEGCGCSSASAIEQMYGNPIKFK